MSFQKTPINVNIVGNKMKKTKIVNKEIKLPDGEHTIENKIYVVKDGILIEEKEVNDLSYHRNENNKTIEGYITALLPSALALINSQIFNSVIYFYIFLVSDYFINYLFSLFLDNVANNDKIVDFFNSILRFINFGKYIFILYLLIISLK